MFHPAWTVNRALALMEADWRRIAPFFHGRGNNLGTCRIDRGGD
jgi:hypothetical protein